MARWSALDERVSHLWCAQAELRQDYRLLAQRNARVMREVAVTRRDIARCYEVSADHAMGHEATYLRARAHQLGELADRALESAEQEEIEASGG